MFSKELKRPNAGISKWGQRGQSPRVDAVESFQPGYTSPICEIPLLSFFCHLAHWDLITALRLPQKGAG